MTLDQDDELIGYFMEPTVGPWIAFMFGTKFQLKFNRCAGGGCQIRTEEDHRDAAGCVAPPRAPSFHEMLGAI